MWHLPGGPLLKHCQAKAKTLLSDSVSLSMVSGRVVGFESLCGVVCGCGCYWFSDVRER